MSPIKIQSLFNGESNNTKTIPIYRWQKRIVIKFISRKCTFTRNINPHTQFKYIHKQEKHIKLKQCSWPFAEWKWFLKAYIYRRKTGSKFNQQALVSKKRELISVYLKEREKMAQTGWWRMWEKPSSSVHGPPVTDRSVVNGVSNGD